ncbi:MAG: hypothetical protein PHU33_05280, partial [Bacteroidales bacterium]|nr:hypothetical protein [Bacteroidales bacterium]
ISNNGKTYNEDDFYRAVNTIFEAVKNGDIKEDTINDSATIFSMRSSKQCCRWVIGSRKKMC